MYSDNKRRDMVWVFERCRFNKEDKIQGIDLMKKVEFEIFNKIYLSLLISDILINWGFSVP
jgi:hypothetical protein